MYEGPAGVVLTRDDAVAVYEYLCAVNYGPLVLVRDRIKRYLDSDWQQRSEQRARTIKRCNPQTHSQS